MPHCIIEYASALGNTVSPDTLVESVHAGTVNSGLFNVSDIKTRMIPFDHCITGTQKIVNSLFIHVCIKILSGRTLEQRHALSNTVLKALSLLPLPSISLTVEVIEIEAQSYSKIIT
ncbi:MAG: 5-carboxymethyl-2-hydroxymuconate isomerase [Granulosicoccus sp.]|jgi:5-carboxymethyl-2-hydroxymuconate isomerase